MYPRHRGRKVLILIALLAVGGYLALRNLGERYLERIVQAQLTRQQLPVHITIGNVLIGFPLKVVLKEVACAIVQSEPAPFFTAKQIVVNPQLIGFMMGRVVLDTIQLKQPALVLGRRSDQAWNISPLLVTGGTGTPPSQPMLLQQLRITNGTVSFTDETVVPAFHGEVQHLDLDVKKLPFPIRAITTSFEATGDWVGRLPNQRAPVTLHGWLDVSRKKGQLDLTLRDLDVTTLEPYFSKKLVTKLYAGLLNLDGHATLNGNDEVLVKADLDLRDLQISGGEMSLAALLGQSPALAGVAEALQQSQYHVTQHLELKYSLTTKRWRFVKSEGNLIPLLFVKTGLTGIDRLILKIQEGAEATGQGEAIGEKLKDAIGGGLQELLDKALPEQ